MVRPKYRIVVVEDNDADVFLLECALESAGLNYELHSIEEGESARRYIQALGEELPDLLLVDLNLPRVNGVELLHALREIPALRKLPVIVWSSGQTPEDQASVAPFGIAHFIYKAPSLASFLEIGTTIRNLLEGSGEDKTDGQIRSRTAVP